MKSNTGKDGWLCTAAQDGGGGWIDFLKGWIIILVVGLELNKTHNYQRPTSLAWSYYRPHINLDQ